MSEEKDLSAALLCGESLASPSRTESLPNREPKKPRIWALWVPFKKNGFPSLGTFGVKERKVVIIPMETWNALCAEIPALQTKEFEVGSYE